MRRRLRILDRGNTFVVTGWDAHRLALSAGVRTVYNGVAQGWVGDGRKLPSLVAYAEYRNVDVEITGHRRDQSETVQCIAKSEGLGNPVSLDDLPELDLFGGVG